MAKDEKRVKVNPEAKSSTPELTKPTYQPPALADFQPTKRNTKMSKTDRNTRPPKCPWNPSSRSFEVVMITLPESAHASIDAIQDALQAKPDVLAQGFTINKGATARAIFLAGIKALAADNGVDIEKHLAAEQAAYDSFYAKNGAAVDAWIARRAAQAAGAV